MRARYYNPYLCRFLNPDPLGFGGGMNFYAYASGNPASYLDPFGLNAAATGDSSFTWTGLWNSANSYLASMVPGAANWNNTVSSFNSGSYFYAAGYFVDTLAEDALFALTFGESEAAAPMLNSAERSITQIGNAAEEVTGSRALVPYYPPNAGFAGASGEASLVPGTIVDRYGGTGGFNLSPQGTPPWARSLPFGAETRPLNAYEVVQPINVNAGTTAPWFNQPGGGLQFELGTRTVQDLINSGHLRPLQ